MDRMIEETKTQSRIVDGGRTVRVVTGWNYTHYYYWFVVYVQEQGRKEVLVPARDAIAASLDIAFERGFAIGAAVRE